MPSFQDLENQTKEYMLLADEGILKLLFSFVVGCKLPLPPPWLFIVSGPGGGKTKLVQLLENVPGYKEVDDLTTNTLLSGKKSHEGSPSFLHNMEDNGFIVFKDFTSILSKFRDQLTAIIGQLRMVYDGKFVKYTGQDSNAISYSPKKAPGLIAAVTTKIHTTSQEWAEMGQRFMMYHMLQPDNMEVGRWIIGKRRDEKAIEDRLKKNFTSYLNNIKVPSTPEELPEMDERAQDDLLEIAYLTVMSRSPIERRMYSRDREIEMAHDHEMIGRFLKQLMSLAYGMMVLNNGPLLNSDRKILYKIGLDSIPAQRFAVMRALTANRLGGDMEQIGDYLRLPKDTVSIHVGDLVALGIVENNTFYFGGGKKKRYHIKDKYMKIISKFEGIQPEEKELPPSEVDKAESSTLVPPPDTGKVYSSAEFGLDI